MKKAIYLTTESEFETKTDSCEIFDYCERNDFDLDSFMYVKLNTIACEPERLIQRLREQGYDVIISDDDHLLYSDIMDFEAGFLQELDKAGIECIHIVYDRPMKELAGYINSRKSESLVRKQNEIHGLLVYKGDEGSRQESDFREMRDVLQEHIDNSSYAVLYYKEESMDLMDALRSVIANNPLDYILMQEKFISREGMELMKQLNDMKIDMDFFDILQKEQEERLWHTLKIM